MFGNQSALDLEEVEMLHLVRASGGRHPGKDATVHRDLGLRGVDPGAGGPYGDPIAFSNHLVQDMAFLQGVETLVELPHAPGVDFPSVIVTLGRPEGNGPFYVSDAQILELTSDNLFVLFGLHTPTRCGGTFNFRMPILGSSLDRGRIGHDGDRYSPRGEVGATCVAPS
jgi:hypothetical protein